MRNICILDTETTGLEPNEGKIVEIAAIFYNIPTQTIIHQVSTLIHTESNPAFDVNKISPNALQAVIIENQRSALNMIHSLILMSDAVVAHNAKFDRAWIESYVDGLSSEVSRQKEWICTKEDFIWPVRKGLSLNLVQIAVDLGVPVVSAHRALSDCQLLANCFSVLPDLKERFIEARKPKDLYIAQVSYDQKDLAKDAGFNWNPDARVWERRLTPEMAATLPFKVVVRSTA